MTTPITRTAVTSDAPARRRLLRDRSFAATRRDRRRPRPLPLLVALVIASAGLIAFPTSAWAAELGPGYQAPGFPLDHLGAYITADGAVTYCIDVGKPSTVGAPTTDDGTVDRVNGLSPDEMLELSFVLAEYGTTTDAHAAAAVAMTVWGIASGDEYDALGGDERVLQRVPESERAAIRALADRFRAEAGRFSPVTPSAAMTLSIDAVDENAGFLDVAVTPSAARGTVTLTNAVFADSGVATRAEVADGEHIAIVGTPRGRQPRDGDGVRPHPAEELPTALQPYRVTAEADGFTAPGEPSGNVRLFTTPGAQSLVAASAGAPTVFGASVTDTRDRDVPTLSTIAQATGLVGGTIRDSAIVEHVPSSGLQLEWAAFLQPATSTAPICTDETIVFETDLPLTVTSDGTYPSAEFATTDAHIGTIHWVATLTRDGDVVAQGRCGDPTETTIVSPAPPRLPIVSG